MVNVLLTGATGGIGQVLHESLKRSGYTVLATTRSPNPQQGEVYADLKPSFDWSGILNNIDIVIHCAGIAHNKSNSKSEFDHHFNINYRGTVNLALQAKNRVNKFIFISTIKVHGEEFGSKEIHADDKKCPDDPYALSKCLAEDEVIDICSDSVTDFVIIRPPLVIGLPLTGNLIELSKLLKLHIPIPTEALKHNERAVVSVENLIDFILVCIENPKAKNEKFFVRDRRYYSTYEIMRMVAERMGTPVHSLTLSKNFISKLLLCIGRKKTAQKLFGNQRISIRKNKELLNWTPKW